MKKTILGVFFISVTSFGFAQQYTAGGFLPDSVNPVYSATTGSEAGWSLASTDDYVIMGTLVNEAVIYERDPITDTLGAQSVLSIGSGGFSGYGGVVAIDGNTAAVGAGGYQDNGAVFVYRLIGGVWNPEDTLTASDGTSGANFGQAIALDGDIMAVSATGDAGGTGAVYLFNRVGSDWTESDKYFPTGAFAGDGVGTSVALSGDTMLCTAPNHYNGTPGHTGIGYVCSISGGGITELQTLTAGTGQWSFYDNFGVSSNISDNGHLLIGANGSEVAGTDCGAVFGWFEDGGSWSPMQPITPDNPQSGEKFGTSINSREDVFAIGAPGYDSWLGRVATGVLEVDLSFKTANLSSTDIGPYPSQGQSVAFMNNRVLVGSNYGEVYIGLNDTGGFRWWDQCLELFETDIIWSGSDLVSQDFDADSYTWYWIDESGLFSVPTQVGVGNTHTPTNGGRYYLVLEKDGCQVHVEIFVSLVGIEDVVFSEVKLSPNPVSNFLRINTRIQNAMAEIISIDGKAVSSQALAGTNSVDVSSLQPGVYVLRLTGSNGVGQSRFVKVNQ